MDNTQINAPDGSWFLFGDWQGLTRISLPGDKVKTDAGLDRPHSNSPLALRPSGMVWFEFATDVDPLTLKKVRPALAGHHSPDPLDGADLIVGFAGEKITVRGEELLFEISGDAIALGGSGGRTAGYLQPSRQVFADGRLLILGDGRWQASHDVGRACRRWEREAGVV